MNNVRRSGHKWKLFSLRDTKAHLFLTESRENKQNIALVDVNMSNILTSFVKIKKQYFKIRVKVMYHILILQWYAYADQIL